VTDGRAIVSAFWRELLAELARQEAPREACALALVRPAPPSDPPAGVVVGVVPIENVAAEPEESFELAPAGQALAALLRASGFFDVVVFHSHARGPAHPSSGDIRYGQPGDSLLIYSVELDELRAFVLEPGGELDRRRVRAVEVPAV
jgi:proteasome lid subunit RPN8/RPN11